MRKGIRLTKRDLEMFRLIWRLKVCSTKYLALMFFSDKSLVTAYNRLLILRRAGYLQIRPSKNLKQKLWQLDNLGFKAINENLVHLKEKGYKSESPFHDHKVSVVQMGIFDFISSENVMVITEQELRRFNPDVFPYGVPTVGHRPDGYWVFQEAEAGSKIVSLEVELSRKTDQQYRDIAMFYDLESDIHLVLWVVENTSLANKIASHIQTTSQENINKHIFIAFDGLMENGIGTEIISGVHRGTKLGDMLGQLGAQRVMPSECHGMMEALANTNLKHCN